MIQCLEATGKGAEAICSWLDMCHKVCSQIVTVNNVENDKH